MPVVLMSMLPILAFAQTKEIRETYLCSDAQEYMQIDKSNYKIIRTQVCAQCMDLDKGDSIASYGSVEYVQDGFIKLQSDRDNRIIKNIIIEGSHDKSIKNSVKIRVNFPFKGKFRIEAALAGLPFKSTENHCITIRKKAVLSPLILNIYNIGIKCNGQNGEYLGRIAFCDFPWREFKDENTNSLLITIPNLTNSYFARYFIDGEYVKVEKNKIIWRNRVYKKILEDLITPKVGLGDLPMYNSNGGEIYDPNGIMDDPNGVDIADKLLK